MFKISRIKKTLTLICSLSLCVNLNAKEFNLEELINIALENNTNIKVSKNEKDVKVQEVKKAKSAYLPKLSASADIGTYDIKSLGTKQEGEATSVSLNAKQLIYDFGKTSSSIDSSKYNLDASSSEISSNTQSTIFSVKETYYDILDKYQQIEVAKESVKLDELQLSQAKAYFKAGIRTQIDVTNARLNLSNSQLKLIKADYSYKIARTKLISILGLDKQIDIKTNSNDIKSLAINSTLIYKDLEYLVNIGLKQRPEIQKYDSLIKANRANIKNVKSQYYPTLDVNASYTDKNSDDISSLESRQTAVLLNLKWDLYTGSTTDADKKIAVSKLSSSTKQLDQTKLEITQDITNAYFNMKQSFDSIQIGLLSLDLSVKNLDLANERYKAGLNDLLEVNDAKLEYTQAKTTLINAYYTYLSNNAQVEYSLGSNYNTISQK